MKAQLAVTAVLTMSAAVAGVSAQPITFDFTGTVRDASPGLEATFAVGTAVTGSYTFDSNAADAFPERPDVGYYALTALSFTASGYTATHHPFSNGFITVFNADAPFDLYEVQAPLSGPQIGTRRPDHFHLQLHDFTGEILDSGALPLTPPSLSGINEPRLFVSFVEPAILEVRLTSLTATPAQVPEPGTLALVALVGLALVAMRKSSDG